MASPVELYKPEGLVVPMVTPLLENGFGEVHLDHKSLEKLTQKHFSRHVDALFVAGGCGEMYTIPRTVRMNLIKGTTAYTKDSIPVLAGISAPTLWEVRQHAITADRAGAHAVVVNLMFGDGEPEEKLDAITRLTNLPIIAYDIPQAQGKPPLDAKKYGVKLLEHPQVVGIKVTTGEEDVIAPWLELTQEGFHVLPGSTRTFKYAIENGAQGWVLASGNVVPDVFSKRALLNPDGSLNEEGWETALNTRKWAGAEPKELKESLVRLGIISSPVMFPNEN